MTKQPFANQPSSEESVTQNSEQEAINAEVEVTLEQEDELIEEQLDKISGGSSSRRRLRTPRPRPNIVFGESP